MCWVPDEKNMRCMTGRPFGLPVFPWTDTERQSPKALFLCDGMWLRNIFLCDNMLISDSRNLYFMEEIYRCFHR